MNFKKKFKTIQHVENCTMHVDIFDPVQLQNQRNYSVTAQD